MYTAILLFIPVFIFLPRKPHTNTGTIKEAAKMQLLFI